MSNQPKATKVLLPIVSQAGIPFQANVLNEIQAEYALRERGEEVADYVRVRMQERGEILDYRKTLEQMVKRARNSERGMDYAEMEQTRPIVEKLKAADTGGHVLLDDAEFAVLCEKVKMPYIVSYNEVFDAFVRSVLESSKVNLVEAEEPGQEAG